MYFICHYLPLAYFDINLDTQTRFETRFLMPAPHPSTITLVILMPLIAWRMYARVRKLVGRQRLSKIRPWITLAIFPLILVALGFLSREHIDRLSYLLGGLVIGAGLAVYGLKKLCSNLRRKACFIRPMRILVLPYRCCFFAGLYIVCWRSMCSIR